MLRVSEFLRQSGKLLLRIGPLISSGKGDPVAPRPGLSDLFLSFLRLGLTAFGGPAMVAYIGDLSVRRKGWLDQEAFKGGTVLAQSIPGATAMQAAAYVGLHTRGIPGAIASYTGFGLPAFVLMLILSALYAGSRDVHWVASLFAGLQVLVVAVVANATYTFGRGSIKRVTDAALAAASAAAFWFHVSPFYVIIGAAAAGLLVAKATVGPRAAAAQGEYRLQMAPLSGLVALLVAGLVFLYLINPSLLSLALLMLKIDLFAFGGGFASVPLMLQQVVHVQGWMDSITFMDGIALGQITPGPIVITATFVGYMVHGIAGAVVATLAIFTPSFLLLVGTAPFFHKLKTSPIFAGATKGILASFVGLLLYVTIKFALAVPWDLVRVGLAVATLIALFRKIDLIYIVPIAAALSIILF